MGVSEQELINKVAGHAESVTGVRKAYKFAENPDNLVPSQLPALLFHPMEFVSEPKAHYNKWQVVYTLQGVLFVAERQSRGGRLKYLENAAMPFGSLFREKFFTDTVIKDMLTTGPGLTTAWLSAGTYGAGGQSLTMDAIPYIGWVFTWTFTQVV